MSDFSVEFRSYDKLVDSSTGHILMFLDESESDLIDKLYVDSDNLIDVCKELRTGIMGFDYWKIDPLIFEDNSLIDKNGVAKILPPSLIDNYQIIWQTNSVDVYKKTLKCPKVKHDDSIINASTWNLYKSPKIVVRGTSQRLTAAIDYNGEYGLLVAAHAIIPKNKDDFEYITGIINSNLLNWFHLKKLMGGRIPEGSLSYPVDFYEKIPIKKNSIYKKNISECVKDIIRLKRAYSDYFETWNVWSEKIPSIAKRTFLSILKSDGDFLAKGDMKYVVFSNVSFYPDNATEEQKTILKKKYEKMSIIINVDSSSIEVFGKMNENWERIYNLKLDDVDLLSHFYLVLINRFESRAKPRSLNDLLEKTEAPVLLPIRERTPNILKVVQNEYTKINNETKKSLSEIISGLDENLSKLDAFIFKTYDLNKDESVSVMDFLSLHKSYQKKVLDYFEQI